jgi:molybdenum cofactor cytidylyltransferase
VPNNYISYKKALILLAAGMAKRMGSLKQLLPLGTSTIMGITLDNIMASNADKVIVVVGAMAEETSKIASRPNVTVVNNPDYKLGMSTSLVKGIKHISQDAQLVMIALADQPLIKTETYNLLFNKAEASQKRIAVPVYQGQKGNPIILKHVYLQELKSLKGDVGGRELLLRHPDDILYVEVDDPGIITNINTPSSYEKIKSEFAKGENWSV